jgi:hypothetical protein
MWPPRRLRSPDDRLGSARTVSIIPPTDRLLPEATQLQCPECGRGCFIGFRADHGITVTCGEHGSFYDVDERGRVVRGANPQGVMNPEERLWVIDSACRVLASNVEEGNFLIVQSTTLECNYLSVRILAGHLRVEVSSRDRGCARCGDHPLSWFAIQALTDLGFTIPGPRENAERWSDDKSPRELAVFMERCLLVAFDEPCDVEVTVYMAREEDMGSLAESLSVPMR